MAIFSVLALLAPCPSFCNKVMPKKKKISTQKKKLKDIYDISNQYDCSMSTLVFATGSKPSRPIDLELACRVMSSFLLISGLWPVFSAKKQEPQEPSYLGQCKILALHHLLKKQFFFAIPRPKNTVPFGQLHACSDSNSARVTSSDVHMVNSLWDVQRLIKQSNNPNPRLKNLDAQCCYMLLPNGVRF